MCGSDHLALSLKLFVRANPLCMDRVGSSLRLRPTVGQLQLYQSFCISHSSLGLTNIAQARKKDLSSSLLGLINVAQASRKCLSSSLLGFINVAQARRKCLLSSLLGLMNIAQACRQLILKCIQYYSITHEASVEMRNFVTQLLVGFNMRPDLIKNLIAKINCFHQQRKAQLCLRIEKFGIDHPLLKWAFILFL